MPHRLTMAQGRGPKPANHTNMKHHPRIRLRRLRRIVPLVRTIAECAATALLVGGMLWLTVIAFGGQA